MLFAEDDDTVDENYIADSSVCDDASGIVAKISSLATLIKRHTILCSNDTRIEKLACASCNLRCKTPRYATQLKTEKLREAPALSNAAVLHDVSLEKADLHM